MFGFLKRLQQDPKEELKKVLGDVSLPVFPNLVLQLLEKIRDPNTSSNEVAELLALDPGMSVKVITTVNSAAFSPRNPVSDLGQAVAMLGLSSLETLIVSISVGNLLPKSDRGLFSFDRFWQTALRRAALARAIADATHHLQKVECFTAGLLQDMAIPYLHNQYPNEYDLLLQEWRETGTDLAQLEREKFGWDHAEVATWLCGAWDLPESLAVAIGGHHGTVDTGEVPEPVALMALVCDDPDNPGLERLKAALTADHNMSEEDAEALIATAIQSADELATLMN